MKIFLGMVINKNTGDIVHSHVSMSPDDTFHVEIWDDSGKSMITGEYRKWHHLVKEIENNHKTLETLYQFKEVDENDLIDFLNKKPDTSFFSDNV